MSARLPILPLLRRSLVSCSVRTSTISRSLSHQPVFLRRVAARKTTQTMQNITCNSIAPAAGPYSHAVKAAGTIYCSGQIPWDKDCSIIEGTIQDKTALCIQNLKAVLQTAGARLEDVVKVNIFLADMGNFADMNEEYAKWFVHKPARSCVAVKTLPKNVDIEIECIAVVPATA